MNEEVTPPTITIGINGKTAQENLPFLPTGGMNITGYQDWNSFLSAVQAQVSKGGTFMVVFPEIYNLSPSKRGSLVGIFCGIREVSNSTRYLFTTSATLFYNYTVTNTNYVVPVTDFQFDTDEPANGNILVGYILPQGSGSPDTMSVPISAIKRGYLDNKFNIIA